MFTANAKHHLHNWRIAFVIVAFSALIFVFIDPTLDIGDYGPRLIVMLLLLTLSAFVAWYKRLKATHTVAMALAALFCSYLFLAYHGAWCCPTVHQTQALCDMVAIVSDRLDRAGIDYWVCAGTLLGAVRDHELAFQMIPWEHDFDLCIFEKDLPRVVEALDTATTGLMVSRAVARGYKRALSPQTKVVRTWSLGDMLSRTYVDFYLVNEREGKLVMPNFGGGPDASEVLPVQANSKWKACNMQGLKFPKDAVGVLKKTYGPGVMGTRPQTPDSLVGLQCAFARSGCAR